MKYAIPVDNYTLEELNDFNAKLDRWERVQASGRFNNSNLVDVESNIEDLTYDLRELLGYLSPPQLNDVCDRYNEYESAVGYWSHNRLKYDELIAYCGTCDNIHYNYAEAGGPDVDDDNMDDYMCECPHPASTLPASTL